MGYSLGYCTLLTRLVISAHQRDLHLSDISERNVNTPRVIPYEYGLFSPLFLCFPLLFLSFLIKRCLYSRLFLSLLSEWSITAVSPLFRLSVSSERKGDPKAPGEPLLIRNNQECTGNSLLISDNN